jgi:hypothetical protein
VHEKFPWQLADGNKQGKLFYTSFIDEGFHDLILIYHESNRLNKKD